MDHLRNSTRIVGVATVRRTRKSARATKQAGRKENGGLVLEAVRRQPQAAHPHIAQCLGGFEEPPRPPRGPEDVGGATTCLCLPDAASLALFAVCRVKDHHDLLISSQL